MTTKFGSFAYSQLPVSGKPDLENACSRREFLGVGLIAGLALRGIKLGGANDLASLPLFEVSQLVRRKSVSPVELTQECLRRIERWNPDLNAFITVDADGAMAQARKAEAELLGSKWRGPLHGIPLTLKDNIDTAGLRTTAASGVFKDRVPTEDAEVVRRLKAAGAVLLGKLNMHEFAFGGTSLSSYFGPVRNPWNLGHIAGGSSGGSAVAVAAGLCYGAIGTDTLGSIRIPAAYCGIVGLKPTYGRVSIRGIIPLSPSIDHAGPMTRTVKDSATMLQALAGYDPEDPTSMDVAVVDFSKGLEARKSNFRLGVPRNFFYEQLDPEIEKAVQDALAVLGRFAQRVEDIELPEVDTLPVGPTRAEIYAFHSQYVENYPELYQEETLQRLWLAKEVGTASYIQGLRSIARLRRVIKASFDTIDLMVVPTMAISPPTVGEAPGIELEQIRKRQLTPLVRNTSPFNIYGLPSLSIPCGFTTTGLPIGLQIVGPPWGEAMVLRLAYNFEQATNWRRFPPTI